MANEIEAIKIEGSSVYGVDQMAYSVNGKKGLNLGDAIFHVSTLRAAAIEEDTASFAKIIKLRHAKLEYLGNAMATISQQLANYSCKKPTADLEFATKVAIASLQLNLYGISRNLSEVSHLQSLQSDVQYAMDKEDNELQQDMVTLQSLNSKRDQAYSTASSLMNKFNKGMADTIKHIGG